MKASVWFGVWIVATASLLASCKSQPEEAPARPEAPAQPSATPAGPTAAATPSVAAPAAALNPVQNEMRLLHEATRDWVTAIANNTLDTIPEDIHKVHGARMVTEDALKKGSYKPPKNADDLDGFIKQDEAFHDELVKLLKASKAKDLPATTKQLGVVLEGCTSCHTKYRF